MHGREIFLEKLSVLSFSDPQSTSKIKSKHPVALNEREREKKKTRHLNLALVMIINYIVTSIRTKCTFHRIGQYNKRFYFVSPNLQNLHCTAFLKQRSSEEVNEWIRYRIEMSKNLSAMTHRQTLMKDLIKSLYHTTNNNCEKGKKQGNR